jgi:hypothetical protein
MAASSKLSSFYLQNIFLKLLGRAWLLAELDMSDRKAITGSSEAKMGHPGGLTCYTPPKRSITPPKRLWARAAYEGGRLAGQQA